MTHSFLCRLYNHFAQFFHPWLIVTLHFHLFLFLIHSAHMFSFFLWKCQEEPLFARRSAHHKSASVTSLSPEYSGNRCCVNSLTEIKDAGNLQMAFDTWASFNCCLWWEHDCNVSEDIVLIKDQRKEQKEEEAERKKRAPGKPQTSTLGKFKWLNGSTMLLLIMRRVPLLDPIIFYNCPHWPNSYSAYFVPFCWEIKAFLERPWPVPGLVVWLTAH